MGKIERFLALYQSKSKIETCKTGLKTYFNFIYGEEGDLEDKAERYIAERGNYEEDMAKFQSYLKGKPLKTISLYLGIIRQFLVENGVLIGEDEDQTALGGLWIKSTDE